jgi:hypothetical protein
LADHVNDVANGVQLAVSCELPPATIDGGDAVKVHTGAEGAITVTVALAVLPVPPAFTPATV